MAYISIFLISTTLACCSEQLYRKNKRELGAIVAIIMVVSISIFAGARSTSVGTDTEYYLVNHFNWAQGYKNQFPEFLKYMYKYEEVDVLYIVLVYICSIGFGNVHVLMFALSLITNTFMYLALIQKREQISVSTGWFIYCFILYNTTLNIMRQSCAIAILTYSIVAYDQKKISNRKLIVLGIIATLLHRSAPLAMLIILMLYLFNNNRKYKYLLILLTSLICAFPLFFEFLKFVISRLNFLPIRYMTYFVDDNAVQSGVLLDTIMYMPPTVGLIICRLKCKKREMAKYISMGLICVAASLRSNMLMNRLNYYFIVFFSISIPLSIRVMTKKREGRLIYGGMILFCIVFLWIINIVMYNYGQTCPYTID